MPEEKKIIMMKYPISTDNGNGAEIKSVSIGRLKVKHFKSLPDDFMEKGGKLNAKEMIPLIASITGLPESIIDEMDLEDMMEVAKEMQDFLGKSLATGKN